MVVLIQCEAKEATVVVVVVVVVVVCMMAWAMIG